MAAMEEAEALIEKLHALNVTPSADVYHAMMYGFGGLADVSKVQMYLDEFVKQGYKVNAATKMLLVDAYANGCGVDKVREVLEEIWAQGTSPTADHFYALAKAVRTSRGNSSDAEAVLHEMRSKGLRPNARIFTEILVTCVQSKEFGALSRLITIARNQYETRFDYAAVVEVLTALAANHREAQKRSMTILKAMIPEPSEETDLEQRGQYSEALVFVYDIRKNFMAAEVAFEEAKELRKKAGKKSLDDRTVAAMIQLLVVKGDIEGEGVKKVDEQQTQARNF